VAAVNTYVYGEVVKDRLTITDWIKHGLRTLAGQGENALKVGALAAGLNVSRGSFYWHFKDIDDYRQALLREWQQRAGDQVIRDIDATITGPARLTALMRLAFEEDRSLDRAIRSWANTDSSAAEVVASVDVQRVAYIAKLLTESGVERRKAMPRAEFIYWAYIGQSAVMHQAHTAITETDIDDLSALFTH
jgi:AcrR family transcriptional regulator